MRIFLALVLMIGTAHADDLEIAYALCTKRYINRDKSIDEKWQPGFKSCDKIVKAVESVEQPWNDVNQHKAKIDAIAGALK
jgi:hypothetical protein